MLVGIRISCLVHCSGRCEAPSGLAGDVKLWVGNPRSSLAANKPAECMIVTGLVIILTLLSRCPLCDCGSVDDTGTAGALYVRRVAANYQRGATGRHGKDCIKELLINIDSLLARVLHMNSSEVKRQSRRMFCNTQSYRIYYIAAE